MAIRAAFLAVFDQIAGRKIEEQHPEGFVGPDEFDAISEYVIPKPQLCGQLISVCARGCTVIGHPVCMEDPKYNRNALLFNFCFVLSSVDEDEDEAYGRLLAKAAHRLRELEAEASFVSKREQRERLGLLFPQVVRELNATGRCSVPIDEANSLDLRSPVPRSPAARPFQAHEVPVLVAKVGEDVLSRDRAVRQLLWHVDGMANAASVARASGVDLPWAIDCLSDLAFLGAVRATDYYQESNAYALTPRAALLARSVDAQAACVRHAKVAGQDTPHFKTVLELFARLEPRLGRPWTTVAEAKAGMDEADLHDLDVRKALQFAVLNGYARRVHLFPVRRDGPAAEDDRHTERLAAALGVLPVALRHDGGDSDAAREVTALAQAIQDKFLDEADGTHSMDELCLQLEPARDQARAKARENALMKAAVERARKAAEEKAQADEPRKKGGSGPAPTLHMSVLDDIDILTAPAQDPLTVLRFVLEHHCAFVYCPDHVDNDDDD